MREHPNLPLPFLLAIRTHLGKHRALSLVTVCAITASVALATGLEMASRSAEAELQRTARELAGAAEIEVVGGTLGVSEDLLDIVAGTPGVRVAVPFVQASFRVDRTEVAGTSIHVLGVDLLADPSIRAYSGEATVEDPLRLIAGTDAVIVSRLLAERLGLHTGDTLPVRSGHKPFTLTVRGVLAPKGIAEAYGGQIAVMDVYALQAMLGRTGWLDRIDVVVSPGSTVDSVIGAIRAELGGRATVRRSASHDTWIESALAMIRIVVSALMVVAVVVASLVSYSALSLFVDRRLPELALLRAAGLEPSRVRRFLYLDAALLATLGVGAGLLIGWALSEAFLTGLSGISGFLQGVELQRLEFKVSTVATAVVVGGVVAFGGVLEPAWRATRAAPLETLLGGPDDEVGVQPRLYGALIAISLVAVLCLMTLLVRMPPLVRVAAIMATGLISLGLFAHFVFPHLLRWARLLIEVVFPGAGRLAGASLIARPAETALSFVCVGGVVAGVTISLTLAQSAAHSLDKWMESQFPGGVFVTPAGLMSASPEDPISPETTRLIRETPGVRVVFEHVGEQIVYRNEEVLLVAGNMDVLARFGRLPVVHGDPRAVAEAVAGGEIVISDGFAQHFGVSEGQTITLDTPKGSRSFRVAGVIRDYAGPAGSLNMDISVFDELWPRRGSRDLVLWTEGDPGAVITQIRQRLGDGQTLFFVYGDDLARFASHLLRRFQAILAGVSLMTAFLGGIAVWNLMLSAVTARTRELASLLAMGATQWQVRALTLIDGLLLGVGGGIGGMVLGVCSAYPIVSRVTTDALGWSLTFSLAPIDIILLTIGLLVASLLASFYPSSVAAGIPMGEATGVE